MNDMKKPIPAVEEPVFDGRQTLSAPPIDLDHLDRQTLGDKGIAREVLGLFLVELGAARAIIISDVEDERRDVAHRLRGAASAIGAFALAESAAEIEHTPKRTELVSDCLIRIREIEAFISSYDG